MKTLLLAILIASPILVLSREIPLNPRYILRCFSIFPSLYNHIFNLRTPKKTTKLLINDEILTRQTRQAIGEEAIAGGDAPEVPEVVAEVDPAPVVKDEDAGEVLVEARSQCLCNRKSRGARQFFQYYHSTPMGWIPMTPSSQTRGQMAAAGDKVLGSILCTYPNGKQTCRCMCEPFSVSRPNMNMPSASTFTMNPSPFQPPTGATPSAATSGFHQYWWPAGRMRRSTEGKYSYTFYSYTLGWF